GVMREDPEEPRWADPLYPKTQSEIVAQEAIAFLDDHAGAYWPRSVGARGFLWELLAGPGDPGAAGPARFRSQVYKANIDPTERYVLSVVGSTRFRLSPGESGF